MHKKPRTSIGKKIVYTALVIVLIVSVFVGVYAYSLMNNPDYITLGVGETHSLTPRESDYKVRSYNAGVITPSAGSAVVANMPGDAVVCVKYTYFDRDFYRFKVIDAPKSVTLNKNELTLGEGESYKLNAQCSTLSHDFTVSYASSDDSIAKVSENGYVTALKSGECTITASSYNGKSDSCQITVKKAPHRLKLSKSSVTLGEGETLTLTPVFQKDEYAYDITLTSSDESVATISDNTLTATGTGECTITAKPYNDVTATCKVTVNKMAQTLSLVVLDKYDVDSLIRVVTDIEKGYSAYNIDISVSDESVLKIDEKNKKLLHPQKQGECTITATLQNGVTASKTVTIGDYSNGKINLSSLNQFPSLPTGCEAVALTSVLNYYGEDVSMHTMVEKYMPMKKYDYFSVSPHDYFLGTPYSFESGMGCFSGCIVKTANNYFKDKNIDDYYAMDITGCSTDELYNYLSNGVPVITWVTSSFVTPTVDGRWTVNGETITWCNHEHCLVTTGYDKASGNVTVADNSGGYSYSVSMSQYEKVFKGMGSMAVVVLKK